MCLFSFEARNIDPKYRNQRRESDNNVEEIKASGLPVKKPCINKVFLASAYGRGVL